MSTFDALCNDATHEARRREIDRWLEEIGARVIRVEDLGAAMEAHDYGLRTAALADNTHAGGLGMVSLLEQTAREQAETAAHLARLALGEA